MVMYENLNLVLYTNFGLKIPYPKHELVRYYATCRLHDIQIIRPCFNADKIVVFVSSRQG